MRRTRASDSDRCFPQPDNWDTPVWRYINFAKLPSLAMDGLWLSRVDCLGDDWEGALPQAMADVFGTTAQVVAQHGGEHLYDEVTSGLRATYNRIRQKTFASCWQLAEDDAWWMWKVYCGSEFGVAMKSTYERLDRVLPPEWNGREILIGKVTYGDYSSGDYLPEPSSIFSVVMSKRIAFQDEREVRVLCDHGHTPDDLVGINIAVNLDELLTSIVVSPLAPPWFRRTVERTIRSLGCQVIVEESKIGLPARFL